MTIEERNMIVRGLQTIVRNDTTRYEHHQARRWDGRTPREAGEDGTRWLEPAEVAAILLRRIGAEVPDSYKEMVDRVSKNEGR